MYIDRNEQTSRYIAYSVGCAKENTTQFWNNATAVNNVLACLRNKSALELSSQQLLAEKAGITELQSVALDSGPNAVRVKSIFKTNFNYLSSFLLHMSNS